MADLKNISQFSRSFLGLTSQEHAGTGNVLQVQQSDSESIPNAYKWIEFLHRIANEKPMKQHNGRCDG